MQKNNFLFGTEIINARNTDIGLLILRVFAGLALAFGHGLGKIPPSEGFIGMVGNLGLPAPGLMAWFSGLAEFAGGILLALGLLTRPAALFIFLNMTTAVFLAHAGQSFGEREKALLFAFIALQFLFSGAGRYSIDANIGKKKTAATSI
ncbi:DoxX family protein [Catalinimonas niigatensis]|uniref:DoxX family protein n=1 Tax=Catalinimonas niigatensis TaxID=1397264 RepID=UPI00266619BF|nr:DoxX family protein [Catalinimonas niigatensis]WPP50470.1 DoxX family protein [Catalinimonas niigatensis]